MNTFGGTGLWDDQDGFYYDAIQIGGHHRHLRARSMIGLIPLLAVMVLEDEIMDRLPWLQEARQLVSGKSPRFRPAHHLLRTSLRQRRRPANCWRFRRASGWSECCDTCSTKPSFSRPTASARCRSFITITHARVHSEFGEFSVNYDPGESTTSTFGGNSNWRGPIWFPVNYAIIEALQRYHYFYGDHASGGMPDRFRPLDESGRSRGRTVAAHWSNCSCPTKTAAGPATATIGVTPTIRTGAT